MGGGVDEFGDGDGEEGNGEEDGEDGDLGGDGEGEEADCYGVKGAVCDELVPTIVVESGELQLDQSL